MTKPFVKPNYDRVLKLMITDEMWTGLQIKCAGAGCGVSAYVRKMILDEIQEVTNE